MPHALLLVSGVASDHDPTVPRVVLDRIRESVPDATLDIIRDARHYSAEESPERIAGVIARLLVPEQ